MRVVHYLNQFFGGLGGEEHAGAQLEVREGAVGPGKLLEQLLGADAKIITTLICGDNYAVEQQDSFIVAALEKISAANAQLFVAGPCFLAGRYGMAAGALCSAVQSKIGIPVITGMACENPGADLLPGRRDCRLRRDDRLRLGDERRARDARQLGRHRVLVVVFMRIDCQ